MNHTPGPWGLAQYAKGAHLPIPFQEHKTITVFSDGARHGDIAYMQHGLWGDDQAEANARLIAAAPELLKALIDILPLADFGASEQSPPYAEDHLLLAAQAAIAKATGGSHER